MSTTISIGKPRDEPNDDKAKSSKPNKRLGYLIEGGILLLAVALGLLIRLGWLEMAIVTSDSMLPTLRRGDRLLVDHRASLRGTWERGDIVFFDAPTAWGGEGETLVKRVVGLPYDVVWFRGGQLWINDAVLPEPYLNGAPPPDWTRPVTLSPGQYFVLGDNRGNSEDSRVNGPLTDSDIHGRALRLIGPWGRSGALPETGYPRGKWGDGGVAPKAP